MNVIWQLNKTIKNSWGDQAGFIKSMLPAMLLNEINLVGAEGVGRGAEAEVPRSRWVGEVDKTEKTMSFSFELAK